MKRTIAFLAAIACLVALSAPASSARSRSHRETRTYAGVGFLNLAVTGPGINVDCRRGVTCIEVHLAPADRWADFFVDDVSRQAVGGWALGWSPELGYQTLLEFCGGSEAPINVDAYDRFVVAFSAGVNCVPAVTPTTGDVIVELAAKFKR